MTWFEKNDETIWQPPACRPDSPWPIGYRRWPPQRLAVRSSCFCTNDIKLFSKIILFKVFSEKPKGHSQQITDFCKSVSHRKFYASIQQLVTDNPLLVWCVPVSPNSPPPSYLPLPLPPRSLLMYCTRLITEKDILIHLLMNLRFLPIYFKQGFSLGSKISCYLNNLY